MKHVMRLGTASCLLQLSLFIIILIYSIFYYYDDVYFGGLRVRGVSASTTRCHRSGEEFRVSPDELVRLPQKRVEGFSGSLPLRRDSRHSERCNTLTQTQTCGGDVCGLVRGRRGRDHRRRAVPSSSPQSLWWCWPGGSGTCAPCTRRSAAGSSAAR